MSSCCHLSHGLVADVSPGHGDRAPDVVTAPLAPAHVTLPPLEAGHTTGEVKAALGAQAEVITQIILKCWHYFNITLVVILPLCTASRPGL